MDWACGWTAVSAIASCVLVAGIGVAIWQIIVTRNAARRNTSAQVAVQLFIELRRENMVKALRSIYRNSPSELVLLLDISPKDECKEENKQKVELRKEIENVIDHLELIGALVARGIIDKKMAIEAYSGTGSLRCWYVLGEYIIKARSQRGGPYCKYFEDFAWRTLEHQKTVSQDERIRFYKDDPKASFDLIKYFIDNPDTQPKKRT